MTNIIRMLLYLTNFIVRHAKSIGLGLVIGLTTQIIIYLLGLYIDFFKSISDGPFIFFYIIISIMCSIIFSNSREVKLPDSIQAGIDYIRLMEEENKLVPSQISIMYISLYNKVLDNVNLSKDLQLEIERLNDKLNRDEK